MLIEELKKIGLNEKEAKIYLALLELGEANIQQLSKKSAVKRTTVYDILEGLKQKGLINITTKNKRAFYLAEDPRKIEEQLDEKKIALRRVMPELLSITNLLSKKPKILYHEGEDGIKDVYRDTLRYPDQELLAWVAEEAVTKFDKTFLDEQYVPKRVASKIWVRSIAPDVPEMQKYKGEDQASLRRTKLIPAHDFPVDVEINLYGKSKVGVMSFEEKFGLIIESPKIYQTLKGIFEAQWETSKDAK
jgi:sugar-specific transcriptional regulator TrmB